MKFLRPILVVTSLSVIIGCSDSPSSPTTATPNEETNISDSEASLPDTLFGAWTTDCESERDGFSFELTEWNFSSTEINVTALSYDPTDVSCTGSNERTEYTYEATYLSDFEETQLGMAIMTDMMITKFVAFDEFGNSIIDSDIEGIPVDANNQFGIFLVESEQLHGGDLSSGDASSAENRPTEIDVNNGLRRKP